MGIVRTDFSGSDNCLDIAIQNDGKIIAVGASIVNDNADIALSRYFPDGTLDESFGNEGIKIIDFGEDYAVGLAVYLQDDGKILIVGSLNSSEFLLVRTNGNGSLDKSFGEEGVIVMDFENGIDIINSLVLTDDGNILVGGISSGPNQTPSDFLLIKYLSNVTVGNSDLSFLNNDLLVYPNPISNWVTIEFSLEKKESLSLELLDSAGRSIENIFRNKKYDRGVNQEYIALPKGLPAGNYFLRFSNIYYESNIQIIKN